MKKSGVKTARQKFKIGDRVFHKDTEGTVTGFTKDRVNIVKVIADGERKPAMWSASYWDKIVEVDWDILVAKKPELSYAETDEDTKYFLTDLGREVLAIHNATDEPVKQNAVDASSMAAYKPEPLYVSKSAQSWYERLKSWAMRTFRS